MPGSLVGPKGPLLTRRRLLAAGMVAGIGAITVAGPLTACSAGGDPDLPDPPAPTPDPDAGRRLAAVEAALALATLYEATVAAHPTLLALLDPLLADHRAHALAIDPALGASPSPSSSLSTDLPTSSSQAPSAPASSAPGSSPTPSGPTTPVVSADPDAARAAVVTAETAASSSARADALGAVDPALARLLASIAASRALHSYLVEIG